MSGTCGSCRHFQNGPAALEGAFPGLLSMGSGYAAVRAEDGLCERHGLYLSARDRCPSYVAAPAGDLRRGQVVPAGETAA